MRLQLDLQELSDKAFGMIPDAITAGDDGMAAALTTKGLTAYRAARTPLEQALRVELVGEPRRR